jgi:integrase
MPRHLADAVLFAINTGCREQEICQLRWSWEIEIPDLKTSVFILPTHVTKTDTERVVALNSIAERVVRSRHGNHRTHVFTYNGHPIKKLNNTAWKRAWRAAGLPVDKTVRRGVHNLRHTFGRRLRSAGVPLETRKALLGHANGDITTHYSAAELQELIQAAERIVDRGGIESPNLMLLSPDSDISVGICRNLSEKCRKEKKA